MVLLIVHTTIIDSRETVMPLNSIVAAATSITASEFIHSMIRTPQGTLEADTSMALPKEQSTKWIIGLGIGLFLLILALISIDIIVLRRRRYYFFRASQITVDYRSPARPLSI
ncbi:unnamed protein product [Didymodactylos carnosus]|uniref:Uncharacterized protein n=1 Tax=Didymodactylos carnosus TaxID=1234261 RepID=A0A8S2GUP9_9BILA|nr:unnamed protein product [Didymodactylos carnosus]CAF3560871.1 unnamed protein product [Didymodactylos carnosus]